MTVIRFKVLPVFHFETEILLNILLFYNKKFKYRFLNLRIVMICMEYTSYERHSVSSLASLADDASKLH